MSKKRWSFGKKDVIINSAPTPDPIPPSSIYHSIHNLPLHRFIDCIVDHNLHSLRIEGNPTELELNEAWNNILIEYTEAIGNHEYKMYISLYKEISLLKSTYKQIEILAGEVMVDEETGERTGGILRFIYSEYLCKELNRLLKTSCRFNWDDQASYQEELSKCMRRSKSIKISIDLKLIRFDAIEQKQKGKEGKQYTRAYFDSMLINLSDRAKFEINETITVSKYCERIKRFSQYVESVKNQKWQPKN